MASTMPYKTYMLPILLVIVPRYFNRGRGLGLRPVNRIKHVVDSQNATAAGTQASFNLIVSNDSPGLANTAQVLTGSRVSSIFLTVEVVATTSAALSNVYMIIFKNPGGNLSTPAANTVGANDDKRYVIHQEMIMMQQQTNSNPRTLFKGVIRIPRGYQRAGPNDVLLVALLAPGVNINFCIQGHYKEFR